MHFKHNELALIFFIYQLVQNEKNKSNQKLIYAIIPLGWEFFGILGRESVQASCVDLGCLGVFSFFV